MLITISKLLFPNSRLMLCSKFSYDLPKIRNLRKIFLRRFENVSPACVIQLLTLTSFSMSQRHIYSLGITSVSELGFFLR